MYVCHFPLAALRCASLLVKLAFWAHIQSVNFLGCSYAICLCNLLRALDSQVSLVAGCLGCGPSPGPDLSRPARERIPSDERW